ncbi:UDP-N-acetylmuramoylalanyl-D-glutamate--2,6-diaminopimelate ligase [Peptoniphilus sp. KCTC 25270]|uniref:Mur ligase family protein n=1 Tax=Peptoniphilus sp. KCTC 25270 TaxID=2897414 RepID=UPI001E5A2C47|nr:Mur ligase family protein [Peptoniphilus sp. KCTC 25270]MCD1147034.1 UDP-N-acetylmuramoylalanyl-D-glutamate--2,6-diaminopimelate ligase [Peptoniphilus sp. KCTC 25270]
MLWNELKKSIDIVDTRGNISDTLDLLSINNNSLTSKENEIFVALKGALTDGHKYVKNAYEKGAKVALVEEFVDCEIPQVKVENTRISMAKLANCFYGYPSKEMKVIGITATNGKTSTAYMIADMLKFYGMEVGIIGTVEIKYGDVVIPSELTTPESIDLQKYLREMADVGVDVVVMEVSSSAQELYRNFGIEYDIVSFHNVSKEHVEQHGSLEKYLEYKSRLIRDAKPSTDVILNIDFPWIESLSRQTSGKTHLISMEGEGDITIEGLDLATGKGKFTYLEKDKQKKIPIELSVSGYHSVLNAMVAITMARILGLEDEAVQEGIHAFTGVERRFELIYDEEFKIIDDHYANPKNIEVTMKTLEEMQYENLYILYAIRGNRGKELNRENADELVKWMKKLNPKNVLATISRDTTGKKDWVTEEEIKSFKNSVESSGYEIEIFEKLEDSVYTIIGKMGKGDVLLLAGCQGMDKGAGFAWKYLLEENIAKNIRFIKNKQETRIC